MIQWAFVHVLSLTKIQLLELCRSQGQFSETLGCQDWSRALYLVCTDFFPYCYVSIAVKPYFSYLGEELEVCSCSSYSLSSANCVFSIHLASALHVTDNACHLLLGLRFTFPECIWWFSSLVVGICWLWFSMFCVKSSQFWDETWVEILAVTSSWLLVQV